MHYRIAAPLLAALMLACAATHTPPSEDPIPVRRYEHLTSHDELQHLVEKDLEQGRGEAAYHGLESFTRQCILDNHATRGNLTLRDAKPVTLFMFSEEREFVGPVEQLQKMLASQAARELDQAYEAIRLGDSDALHAMRTDPLGLLHPDTIALDANLRPHATLVNAMLAYSDLGASPSSEAVETLLQDLADTRHLLANSDRPEGLFLADIAMAQTFEQSQRPDEAAEVWLRVSESEFFPDAPPAMRNAIAARIVNYSERLANALAVQLEEERREELRAMHDSYEVKLNQLRGKHQDLDVWVRAEVAANDLALKGMADRNESLARSRADARAGEASSNGGFGAVLSEIFSVLGPERRVRTVE